MQFTTVALFAAAAIAVNADTVTEVETESTLVTITDCESTVTECPAHSTSAANTTAPISTYEGAAAKGQYAAGFAAVAAGALLAM